MRALIVFESMFGNTGKIAESIVAGLGPDVAVTLASVGNADAAPQRDVDLLVVGAPTHAFGLPRESTRQAAAQQTTDTVATDTGLREWLAGLPSGHARVVAATFDTRFDKPRWVTGSAARKAADRLRRIGYRVVATESFFVSGTKGPLRDGEIERARTWGAQLARQLTSAPS